MPSPNVPQGTLNRLKASLIPADFPQLIVTASYLDKDGIGVTFEGASGTSYGTMTGTVTSPEPYMMATALVRLVRTQSLADAYKRQMEESVLLGDVTVRPDVQSAGISPFQFMNCQIINVGELQFNGQNVGFGVSIQGYWPLNANLWD